MDGKAQFWKIGVHDANLTRRQLMVEDIRKQFFPMRLPNGVSAHSMDRNTALETIELFNDRIFPPGFKEETGIFRPPKERAEKVAHLWTQRIDTHP